MTTEYTVLMTCHDADRALLGSSVHGRHTYDTAKKSCRAIADKITAAEGLQFRYVNGRLEHRSDEASLTLAVIELNKSRDGSPERLARNFINKAKAAA